MKGSKSSVQATNPAFGFSLVFGASLIAAAVLYGAFRSSGVFKSEGVELGGAAAGFLVIFVLSNRIFRGLQDQHLKAATDEQLGAQAERIRELEELVARLRAGELPPVQVPEGFEAFVSRDLGVAFAHPADWKQHPERTAGIYMRPLDEEVQSLGFQGNIVATVTPLGDIEPQEVTEEDLKVPFIGALNLWSGENLQCQSTYISNRKAVTGSFSYPRKGVEEKRNIVEGVAVWEPTSHRLFIFTLYECEELIESSRDLFRRMLSTVTFLT